jgi:hypothetical protein
MAAATDWQRFGRIIRAMWAYDGGAPATRAALKLMALLYTRPGELRLALWDEFDLEKATWTLPASRTKMRREHVKPLPAMAVEILRQLQYETGSNYRVFPSAIARDKPISENTLNQALRRKVFEKDQHTSHGFRASASSLLNESGLWNEDAIEAELAHVGVEVLRAPYLRYVDDFALFHNDRRVLADWQGRIARFLERRRLKLHPRKTVILPTCEPAEFLGYVLLPDGVRRLPEANVARFRGRLRSMRDQWRAGTLSEAEARPRLTAWQAHASFAHRRKLRNAILGEKGPGGRRKPG